ncbi:uncharacterized protein LOC124835629 [Vigna umbellata]|uniref:uncharacterized protein LOC124835629 n=1 Tax=Vigna umbellata TaxID=87088 RepID=UPI001F5FC55E|nr:uncharacterized protein LOC124835629 [Vigna umbellata]
MSGNASNSGEVNPSVSSSVSRSRSKNAPGNQSDIGWKHGFDVNGNGRKVKCNYCSKIVSGGIFRFKHHLAGTREDSEPCASVPDEIKNLMIKVVAEAKNASLKKRKINIGEDEEESENFEGGHKVFGFKGKEKVATTSKGGVQATINQMMKKGYKEEVDAQVAEFFYTSAIPFNVIRNPAFAKMCEMIGKYGVGYKPPSYHDIREKLLKQAVKKTDANLEEYKEEWKKTGCTIMSDGWTDRKRRSICNFLVNSPRGTVFLYSLDTSDISKTADKVFKMLDDVVEFVGEENVVQVVTDNAANFKAAGELLMQKREKLYWTPCAAHCIDLIFEDFEKNLKVHELTIKKGRKITTYIYGRSMLISLLKKFTKGRDLIRPGVTRFATAYLTLACLHELKASLLTMFSSEEWKTSKFGTSQEGRKVAHVVLDSRFWKNVSICLKAAAPLMVVLRLVDSDVKPAMGFIYEEMDCAKEKIRSNFNNIKKSYEEVWRIIDARWDNQLHRPLHAAAYFLNPHFHYEPNFRSDDGGEVKEGLYFCMRRMIPDMAERRKINLQIVEFHNARGLFGMEDAKECRKELNPGEWWDMFGDGTPELKRFAIRILSLTCSSSGCERNWSSFEMVHTKRRNRLHQKKMNDLVYVMYNSKLKSRQIRKTIALPFDDIESDDEWIAEETDDVVEIDQVEGENDSENVHLDGATTDPVLDALDLDNITFENNEDAQAQHSLEEELDDDDDGDDDAIIRGLED